MGFGWQEANVKVELKKFKIDISVPKKSEKKCHS